MSASIYKLAVNTIGELKRRGWAKASLASVREGSPDTDTCAVCLIGAMSSAYNNFDPRFPGYGSDRAYNSKTGQYEAVDEPKYLKFMRTVAEEIAGGPVTWDPALTCWSFNDTRGRTLEDVFAVLERVAAKHKPKAAKA